MSAAESSRLGSSVDCSANSTSHACPASACPASACGSAPVSAVLAPAASVHPRRRPSQWPRLPRSRSRQRQGAVARSAGSRCAPARPGPGPSRATPPGPRRVRPPRPRPRGVATDTCASAPVSALAQRSATETRAGRRPRRAGSRVKPGSRPSLARAAASASASSASASTRADGSPSAAVARQQRRHRGGQVPGPLRVRAGQHRPPSGRVAAVLARLEGGQDAAAGGQVPGQPGQGGQVGHGTAEDGRRGPRSRVAERVEQVERGVRLERQRGHPPRGQHRGRPAGGPRRLPDYPRRGQRAVRRAGQAQGQLVLDGLAGQVGGGTGQLGDRVGEVVRARRRTGAAGAHARGGLTAVRPGPGQQNPRPTGSASRRPRFRGLPARRTLPQLPRPPAQHANAPVAGLRPADQTPPTTRGCGNSRARWFRGVAGRAAHLGTHVAARSRAATATRARPGRAARAVRPAGGHATTGGAPESVAIGRPAAAQSCMPPATLTASQPAPVSACAARAERAPDRQIT